MLVSRVLRSAWRGGVGGAAGSAFGRRPTASSSAVARRGIATTPAKSAQVYAWGETKRGALGLGTVPVETVAAPTRVDVLAGEDVKVVKCFGDNSGAITAKGELYLWGNNDSGKIAADAQAAKFFPFRVRV
jgi:alpha-tubulin suppressor-like RCC1 family protein